MGSWSTLKVAELKEELKRRGLGISGKKAELVARLEEDDAGKDSGRPDAEAEPAEPASVEAEPPAKKQRLPLESQSGRMEEGTVPEPMETADGPLPKPNHVDAPQEGLVSEDDGAAAAAGGNDVDKGEHDVDDDEVALAAQNKPDRTMTTSSCPYLSTINRRLLDFDFEKACSVSLSKTNVYACLVCGRFFTGRGPSTHAYTHALQIGHCMFMRLDSGRVFCLPDNYEVCDASLQDIRHVLNPTFTEEEIASMNSRGWSRDLDGKEYMPGLVGLNNMKANDYANVVLQVILRIDPIRDFFLRRENYSGASTPLLERFGELVRKTNNSRAFRGHVSPHDFMQSVMLKSDNRFSMEKQGDPVQFFSWLLNALHMDLTKGDRSKASVISDSLEGEIEVTTLAGTGAARKSATDLVQRVPYLMLTLDLPPAPLFKDAMEKTVIPQIPIGELLTKFDGVSIQDDVRLGRRKMRILSLPRFLAISVKRFLKNQFFVEKNPTIVNFPAKGLAMQSTKGPATYDLIANVMHDGDAKEVQGTFKVHIHRKSEDIWYEVQDLTLAEALPQVVVLSETTLMRTLPGSACTNPSCAPTISHSWFDPSAYSVRAQRVLQPLNVIMS